MISTRRMAGIGRLLTTRVRKPKSAIRFVLSFLCVCSTGEVFAHPVPKANHDRTIEVRLSPRVVTVRYRLELNEDQAALDLSRLDLSSEQFARITTRAAFYRTLIERSAPLLAANLIAQLDGEPLVFRVKDGQRDESVTDHLRCDFTFEASWSLSPTKRHSFAFREANYDAEDFDQIDLTLAADAGIALQNVGAPERALRERPPLERQPGDSERLRQLSAILILVESVKSDDGERTTTEPPRTSEESSAEPAPQSLLHLLLDTQRGFAVLLLLAAGFGAVHALTPGHGKTLVAAYLVGRHGTVRHALLLGLMTTLTHTGAVFVLAIVVRFSERAASVAFYVQGLVGGLFIVGLGLWLLVQRLFGQPDHFHLGGSHHHHAPLLAASDSEPSGVCGWHLILLGIRGGLIPCWDAILLLCLAISSQRLWLGIPLLLAFSTGLASVLVALGISVVWARDWAVARWGSGERMRKVFNVLPFLSAAAITGLGLWLCYDSLHPERRPTMQRGSASSTTLFTALVPPQSK